MLVKIVQSDYSDMKNIEDVPAEFFEGEYSAPLFIAVREGQLTRVDKLTVKIKKGSAVGLWQLGTLGYISDTGFIEPINFIKHDVIYAGDPNRVPEKFRPTYEKLLSKLKLI